jgi:hypothetical protein
MERLGTLFHQMAAMVDYRHRGTRRRVELVLGRARPEGPRIEQLVDDVEAILNEETYRLLVDERGWQVERYAACLIDMCLLALRRRGMELP